MKKGSSGSSTLRRLAMMQGGSNAVSLLLVILTIGVLIWHQFGMNTSYVISPDNHYHVWGDDDRSQGGQSVASYSVDEDAFRFQCDIVGESFGYPYCDFMLLLSQDPNGGVDLSGYDSIYITMEHTSSVFEHIRIYLQHFYVGQHDSHYPFKFSMQEIEAGEQRKTYKIDLADFYVPFWWVCTSETNNALPELDNVREMKISTGGEIDPRLVNISLYKVEFRGKWIQESELDKLLLYLWLGWIMLLLTYHAYRLTKSNVRLHRKAQVLKEVANRDELTGLLNRVGVKAKLADSYTSLVEELRPFSIVLLDIDHFKAVNDTHGHDVGDQVLKRFSQCVLARCRKTDHAARWGGEEFVIVCENTSLKEAVTFAEIIRLLVRESDFGLAEQVTCSIGVAESNGEELDILLKRADIALYNAKHNGRDRVEVYSESE